MLIKFQTKILQVYFVIYIPALEQNKTNLINFNNNYNNIQQIFR